MIFGKCRIAFSDEAGGQLNLSISNLIKKSVPEYGCAELLIFSNDDTMARMGLLKLKSNEDIE